MQPPYARVGAEVPYPSLTRSVLGLGALPSTPAMLAWRPSDLSGKLRKFGKDHPRLHRLLVRKLDELHRYHAQK